MRFETYDEALNNINTSKSSMELTLPFVEGSTGRAVDSIGQPRIRQTIPASIAVSTAKVRSRTAIFARMLET